MAQKFAMFLKASTVWCIRLFGMYCTNDVSLMYFPISSVSSGTVTTPGRALHDDKHFDGSCCDPLKSFSSQRPLQVLVLAISTASLFEVL